MTTPTAIDLHKKLAGRAFTILELLVAGAVLALLVVLVAQMVGSASLITSGSRKRMAADEEARMVFDRMASDFARMVKREDVDNLFVPGSGNDEMYFYSTAPALYTDANSPSNSPVALVGYRVNGYRLERYGEGKTWDDLKFLTYNNGTPYSDTRISTNSLIATNFQVISPSVFRMEYVFLMKPGTTNATGTNGINTYSQTNVVGQGMKDVSAIVVTLGILDEASRKLVDTNALGAIADTMADATSATSAPSWTTNVTALTNLPARAATRVYQRYFPITP